LLKSVLAVNAFAAGNTEAAKDDAKTPVTNNSTSNLGRMTWSIDMIYKKIPTL